MHRVVLGAMSAVVLGVTATPASAVTRYAEPDGDGPAATCARANPCDIQDAVEDASVNDFDQVVLLPGTYDTGGDEVTLNQRIDVGGRRGGPRPRIVASGFRAFGVVGNSQDTRLHDVVVESTGAVGVGFIYTVERVRVRAFLACAPNNFGVLRDSICEGTGPGSRGIEFGVGCGSPAVLPSAQVRNVTAIASGTGSAAVAVTVSGGCDMTMVGHNVIAQGETDLLAEADGATGSRAELDFNNSAFDTVLAAAGNEVASAPGSEANITAAPLFANPAAGNYRQLPGSPTIDAGRTVSMLGAFDFDGSARVQGRRIDIGADEFGLLCAGRSATIVAAPGTPTIGTSGADVILGTPGGDVIRARGGRDRVCGGGGNDRLQGDGGRDRLYGERGRDRLAGGPGRGDLCKGGAGRDRATRSCERVRQVP